MQDLLLQLLGPSDELSHKVYELSHAMPGYQEADQTYNALAQQVRTILGSRLHDQYEAALVELCSYEARAYYAIGLGLRRELAASLDF